MDFRDLVRAPDGVNRGKEQAANRWHRAPRIFALVLLLPLILAAGTASAAGVVTPVCPGSPSPSCQLTTGGSTGFAHPESIASSYGLTIGEGSTIVQTPAFSTDGVKVHNPSIVFQVPVKEDSAAYIQGGLYHAFPTIGWTGHIAAEACLTAAEAVNWPNAQNMGQDTTTCPAEDDLVHTQIVPRSWYQVAQVAPDLYVIQNSGFNNETVSLPVNLQQIGMPMRLHIAGYTYEYTKVHTGPNDYNAACPYNQCGNGSFDGHTASFKVVVLPAALIQLKVQPETILYMPPGNASSASMKVTATFSTVVTAGATTQVDNTQATDTFTEFIEQNGVTENIDKILNDGYQSSTDTKWDQKTTLKTGQALEHDLQGMNPQQFVFTRGINATSSAVPGRSGAYANEPFWNDLIIVLVHPQLAFWDFYGKSTMQLVAASAAGTGLPDDIAIPLGALADCAKGGPTYPNGYPFFTASNQPDTLTAAECKSLAALDPFWAGGQATSLARRGQQLLPRQTYGVPLPGADPDSLDIQSITSNSQTTTNQSTATYASTVEDVVATTESQGLNIGLGTGDLLDKSGLGFTSSVTLKQGSSLDNSTTMTLTFKNSTATTYRKDVQIEGSIKDTVYRGYVPEVEIYQDSVFGSLMFRDPDAPCAPMPQCALLVTATGGTLTFAP